MNIRDPHKLAEKLLDTANAQAGSTSKIALSWFVALVFMWVGSLEPIIPKLLTLSEKARFSARAEQRLEQWKSINEVEIVPVSRLEYERRLSELRNRKQAAERSVVDEIRDLKVAFSVPGFPHFDVPTRFASLVWCALLLGLIAYVASSRARILDLVGQAARLLSDHRTNGILEKPPVVISLPWWTAPLPGRDGLHVTATEYRALAGVNGSKLPAAFVGATLLFLSLLGLRASVVAASVVWQLGHTMEGHGTLLALFAACVITSFATIFFSIYWFRSLAVPDQLPSETCLNAVGRRKMFCGVIALPLASLLVAETWVLRPKLVMYWLQTPRFRRTKKAPHVEVQLAAGFYVNRKSGAVQYVTDESHDADRRHSRSSKRYMLGVRLPIGGRRSLNEHNFIYIEDPLSIQGDKPERHWNRSARIRLIEQAASIAWDANRREDACKFLWNAAIDDLRRVGPSRGRFQIRVYYRLVEYALRSGREQWVSRLIEAINQAKAGDEFRVAIVSWTNVNSRWRKDLKLV